MATTHKRATISLTKDDFRMIEVIKKSLNETTSGALKRCLIFYFQEYFKDNKNGTFKK